MCFLHGHLSPFRPITCWASTPNSVTRKTATFSGVRPQFLVPLATIWIARLTKPMGLDSGRFRRIALGGLILSLTCLAVTTLRAAPHYLAYFNAARGGPANGHVYLLDSNLDWGQDILTLRDYMREQKIDTVALAYFGRVDPAIYGVTYVPLIGEVGERYAVISANLLWSRMYCVTARRGPVAATTRAAVARTFSPAPRCPEPGPGRRPFADGPRPPHPCPARRERRPGCRARRRGPA